MGLMLALLVSVYPLSPSASLFRPELVCLLCIYWITHSPERFGLFACALIGLAQGVIEGAVWGGHMMALTLVGYICTLSYQRIKTYSIWHQTLWIFILVGIHQIVVNWFQGLGGHRTEPRELLLSVGVSALFWPVVSLVIFRLYRLYRIF